MTCDQETVLRVGTHTTDDRMINSQDLNSEVICR